jgi:hypothetical protein
MHHAAQAANGVNRLLLAESVRRKHGKDNLHKLLRDGLHLLIARIGCLQRESIAPGCFPSVGPVGIGEEERRLEGDLIQISTDANNNQFQ